MKKDDTIRSSIKDISGSLTLKYSTVPMLLAKPILILAMVLIFFILGILPISPAVAELEPGQNYFLNEDGEFVPVVCGDGICSIGENADNCPIDCLGISFNAWLETQTIYVTPNEPFTQNVEIDSYSLSTEQFTITSDSELVSFSQDTISIASREKGRIDVTFQLPENPTQSVYYGEIEITNNIDTRSIQFMVNLITQDVSFANTQLNILSSSNDITRPITYQALGIIPRPTDSMIIQIGLEDITGDFQVVREFTNISSTRFEHIDTVLVRDYFPEARTESEMNLRVIISDGTNRAQSAQTLVFSQSFFSTWYFYALLIVLIGLPSLYGLFRLFMLIRNKNQSRKRYILPNFALLPGGSESGTLLEIGKIADTKPSAYFSTTDLTTHALVAGSTGSGKSVTASIIVEEALNKKIPAVIFDPTSQWTGFLSPLKDPNILQYYPRFAMNRDDTRSYRGVIFTPKDDNFDLNFEDYMHPGEVTVFNLSSMTTQEYDRAVKKIIDKMFAKHWEESSDLKLIVVFDEVHRLLDKSAKGVGYSALTKACREFRKWGIGLVMASQVSSDFKEAIGGNVLTEVQLNTKNIEDIKKISKKYGTNFAQRITRMGIGVALIQNPKYNNGKPWFVQFRPPLHNPHKLSEEELSLYEKYTTILTELKAKINKLPDDTTKDDIQMDYNLAYNKLKEGKFKMAEIYVQALQDKLK